MKFIEDQSLSSSPFWEKGIFSNKAVIALVLVALLVAGLKFYLVSDGRMFVIGDDSIRHLSVINTFIENKAIVFPKDEFGGYTAYIYYAPLYHATIAGSSILTGINPMVLQNFSSLLALVGLFVILYFSLKLLIENKMHALAAAAVISFFFPVPAPNPHYMVYYLLIPLATFFILRIFKQRSLWNYPALFIVTLILGLTHSQSMLFYFATVSLALIFGILFFAEKSDLRKALGIWLATAIAYSTAFFLFSFLTPTFWEAILHYYSLTLVQASVVDQIYQLFLLTGPSKNLVFAFVFLVPVIVYCVLFLLTGLILRAKELIVNSTKSVSERFNFSEKIGKVIYAPFILVLIFFIYLLLINLVNNAIQFVSVFIFQPQLPFFAQMRLVSFIYDIALFGKDGLIELVLPYSIGIVVLLIASCYSIIQMIRAGEFKENPIMVIIAAFLFPIFIFAFVSFFTDLGAIINPLILERFYVYTYAALALFSAPFIVKLIGKLQLSEIKSPKNFLLHAAIGVIILFTMLGAVFSASYDVHPVQNSGYVWLTKNTPVKENAPELNFDIMGYYHISKFPLHYSISIFGNELVFVQLDKNGTNYSPVVHIGPGSSSVTIAPKINWSEFEVMQTDDKIFDNPLIGFYKRAN